MIYTIEGTLIGDAQAFIDHAREKYSRTIQLTKDTQKRRTQQNIKMINEYMRKVRSHITHKITVIEARRYEYVGADHGSLRVNQGARTCFTNR